MRRLRSKNHSVRVMWIQVNQNDWQGYGKAATELANAMTVAGQGFAGVTFVGYRNFDWDVRVAFSGPRTYMVPDKRIYRDLLWHTMFEAFPLPDDWVSCLNRCQAVWVPAEWNKQMFIESGVKRPIFVSGYGVDPELIRDYDLPPGDRPYTFLWCGHSFGDGTFGDRKGGMLVLKAYTKLKLPDARLILKVAHGSAIRRITGRDDVRLIAERLEEREYALLHATSDCFVYPSHGEGFGLQPLEAMGCGLPVIMPAYSGMAEFARPGCYIDLPVVGYEPADLYNRIYGLDHLQWAEYSVDDIADRMKWCYEHREEAREIGKQAAQYVWQNWQWGQAGDRGVKVVRDFCERRWEDG